MQKKSLKKNSKAQRNSLVAFCLACNICSCTCTGTTRDFSSNHRTPQAAIAATALDHM